MLFIETEEGFIKIHLTKSEEDSSDIAEISDKLENSCILGQEDVTDNITFPSIRELYQVKHNHIKH